MGYAIFGLASTFVLSLTIFLVYQYGSWKRTRWFVAIIVFMAWFFSLCIIFLLPIDLSSARYLNCLQRKQEWSSGNFTTPFQDNCTEPSTFIDPNVLKIIWTISYWNTFFSTWLIIPILMGYVDNGEFTMRSKLWSSIKYNAIYYSSLGVVGLGFLIYLIAVVKLNTYQTLISFVMALSNAWGMLLLVMFLGYGLVEVPRSFWNKANKKAWLLRMQFEAPKVKEELDDSIGDYEDALAEIREMKKRKDIPEPLKAYAQRLIRKVCPLIFNNSGQCFTGELFDDIPNHIDKPYLISLNHRVRRGLRFVARNQWYYINVILISLWDITLEKVLFLEDVLNCNNSPERIIKSGIHKPPANKILAHLGNVSFYFEKEWIWYCKLESHFMRLLSIVFALMSLSIIWSEVTLFYEPIDLSIFSFLIHSNHITMSGIEVRLCPSFPLFIWHFAVIIVYLRLEYLAYIDWFRGITLTKDHSSSPQITSAESGFH
ncbi:LMBR1-like membrane protein domain-containing protein [Rozella allomycis CSF55]|uniref:LMBR1-like membrane protein domain-containing protein n=1 Tax=Rozella allomycis (strain CSF55) TaxID=988480 RepID=A0A075B2X4_ROZAC|nr:LMBR1-like membrane protein domain-containing protein [Rozella allomycis CSF55]|eukprot:EPZ35123.1 LMBR1-like membrane protein domain-containing protein [Rozella allomycis CSF55]